MDISVLRRNGGTIQDAAARAVCGQRIGDVGRQVPQPGTVIGHWEEIVIVVGIHAHRQGELLEVAAATDALGPLLCLGQRR
ncbi:hypothetical protein SDC9_162923 [bioreactor metagenome]|uniref:Uncharacterized protein n=1 Tax=bioreactor metagenome TaxID=1076179 RepID=A0A645FQD8_9ZZZZ